MKIYISGKITGLFDYKEKFDEVESKLKNMGHTVLNPTILPLGLEYDEYMNLSYAMIDCADGVYMLDNWKDKIEFAKVNSSCYDVAVSTKSNIVCNVNGHFDLRLNSIPYKTATQFCFNNLEDIQDTTIDNILKSNSKCTTAVINIEHAINITIIERVAKSCLKFNILLVVSKSSQKETIEEICEKAKDDVCSTKRDSPPQPKHKNTMLIEVPVDENKRMRFYLNEANNIVNKPSSNLISFNNNSDDDDFLQIPQQLKL